MDRFRSALERKFEESLIGRGRSMSQTLWFLFSFIAVLALIGLAAWLVRRFGGNRLGANTNRGRRPRPAGAGAARQCRTSADDRRSDRYRRGTQYRACHSGTRSDGATARRRGR